MHLKLRRKKPLQGRQDANSRRPSQRKLFILHRIYQSDTTHLEQLLLAADVHLWSAEKYGEKSAC
jgi:hypothetical protein